MEKNIYLIRHFESEHNVARKVGTPGSMVKYTIGGVTDKDVLLSRAGIEQAKTRKVTLEKEMPKPDFVLSSGFERTILSANLLFPNQAIWVDNNFVERDGGDFFSLSKTEIRNLYPKYIDSIKKHRYDVPYPNGESVNSVIARVSKSLQWLGNSSHKNIAIVSHGETIRICSYILNHTKNQGYNHYVANMGKSHIKNGQMVSFTLDESLTKKLKINRV